MHAVGILVPHMYTGKYANSLFLQCIYSTNPFSHSAIQANSQVALESP